VAEHSPSFQHSSLSCTQHQPLNDLCTAGKHVKPNLLDALSRRYQTGYATWYVQMVAGKEYLHSSIIEVLICFKH